MLCKSLVIFMILNMISNSSSGGAPSNAVEEPVMFTENVTETNQLAVFNSYCCDSFDYTTANYNYGVKHLVQNGTKVFVIEDAVKYGNDYDYGRWAFVDISNGWKNKIYIDDPVSNDYLDSWNDIVTIDQNTITFINITSTVCYV